MKVDALHPITPATHEKWSAKCSKSLLPCALATRRHSCYSYHGKLMSVLAESFFLMSSRSGILRQREFCFPSLFQCCFPSKDNTGFDCLIGYFGFPAFWRFWALVHWCCPLTHQIHDTLRVSKSSARRRSSAKRQSRSQLFQSFSPKCGGKLQWLHNWQKFSTHNWIQLF